MPRVADALKNRPLASFFALAYAISWGFWIPLVSYYLRVRPTRIPLSLLAVGAIGAYGPTFSALILTWIESGAHGVRALLSRLLDWRFGVRWYAYALLIPALIRLASIGLYAIDLGGGLELDLGGLYMLLPYFVAALPYGPMAEEAGWRGYALPRLQACRGALESGLILGVLWTFWHAPGFLVPGMALPPVPLGWEVVLNYLLRVAAVSVLFAWVYNGTGGSLLATVLFHASLNSVPAVLTRVFLGDPGAGAVMWVNWLTAGLDWVLVAALVAIHGAGNLSPSPRTTRN